MKKLFDEIPHIESARLCLRRLVDSDLPALAEMTRSEAVYRYLPTFLFEKQFQCRHVPPRAAARPQPRLPSGCSDKYALRRPIRS